jgi:hypothetical protein
MKSPAIEALMASGNGKIKGLSESAVEVSANGDPGDAVLAAGVSGEVESGLRIA